MRRFYRLPAVMAVLALVLVSASPLRSQVPRYNPAALTFGRDSFSVSAGGREIGYQVSQLTRADSGFQFREETRIGNRMEQVTFVRLGPGLESRSVRQTGKALGNDTRIELDYDGGRVTGTAVVPAPPTGQEVRTLAIDTAVSATIVDDNAIHAILPALPWSAGARWDLQVMAGGRNAIEQATLTVADTATVQVPAGTFPAWRAELRMASGGAVDFYVTRDTPHRLVKITVPGSPLEFSLIKTE